MEFFTDYEENGAISMGSDFMQISMSHDFNLQVGQTCSLTQLQMNSVPAVKNVSDAMKQLSGLYTGDHSRLFQVERAEIWIGNSDKKVTIATGVTEKPKSLIQKVLNQVQTSPSIGSDLSQSHPWLNALSPQNYFRSRPVFFVPSHLTVRKAAEILLYLN
jgi:hypothetical protein